MAILKANGKILKANGKVLVKPEGTLPEILFASDDFFNIHEGRLSSSDVQSGDSFLHFQNTYYHYNVFTTSFNSWDGKKRFCDFMNHDVTIDAPDIDDFSIQFYYSGLSGRVAGRLHIGNLPSFFMVYDDNWQITLRNNLPSGAIAYNQAVLVGGKRNLPVIQINYCNYTSYVWNFVSICCKRVDNSYKVYLYVNGLIQFTWTSNTKPDPRRIRAVIESGGSPDCVISEIMLFSYIRASQDMMTYPTNNYSPMF